MNLSTRGTIVAGGEPLIGGFVVEDRPRRVLLRAVGPTLQGMGVLQPLGNPALAIFRHGETVPFVANDDWDQQASVGEIEQAIAKLRPEYRACILLRHVEGRAYEEIAEMLDLPLGTVKTYIHRARNELRRSLAHLRE